MTKPKTKWQEQNPKGVQVERCSGVTTLIVTGDLARVSHILSKADKLFLVKTLAQEL